MIPEKIAERLEDSAWRIQALQDDAAELRKQQDHEEFVQRMQRALRGRDASVVCIQIRNVLRRGPNQSDQGEMILWEFAESYGWAAVFRGIAAALELEELARKELMDRR